MNLSLNFTLDELTVTTTGIVNEPDDMAKEKLLYLASYILQPIRDRWGALRITSGYRSGAVNSKAGGSTTSQHLLGEAVDFQTLHADMRAVHKWFIKDSGIAFGQAIIEPSWIHISLPRLQKPNNQRLIFDGKEYRPWA